MMFVENNKKKQDVTRGYGLLENFLARKRAKIANSLIPSASRDGRILDIGCGKVPYFLIHTDFAEKYGLDQSVADVGWSNINVNNFDFTKRKRLPFEDNFFKVVTSLAVIEHINPEHLSGLFREVFRVLRPGGRFILTTPCRWSAGILKIMAKMKLVSFEEISDHKAAYKKGQIIAYLKEACFLEKNINFGYFEFYLNSWAYADK